MKTEILKMVQAARKSIESNIEILDVLWDELDKWGDDAAPGIHTTSEFLKQAKLELDAELER
jgi:hypothetical protein